MNLDFSVVFDKLPILFEGCAMTLRISFYALLLGMVFGIIGALCRLSSNIALSKLAFLYVWIIRGTPTLVQVFMLYFALPQVGIRLTSMTAGVFGLAFNAGAYITELIRGAILAIDKGQMEAALSLGMKRWQAMVWIVGPQALKICIPGMVNQFTMTLKNSSVVSYIAVTELFRTGEQIIHSTFRSFETYIVVAALYLVMNSIFMVLADTLEKKMVRQSG